MFFFLSRAHITHLFVNRTYQRSSIFIYCIAFWFNCEFLCGCLSLGAEVINSCFKTLTPRIEVHCCKFIIRWVLHPQIHLTLTNVRTSSAAISIKLFIGISQTVLYFCLIWSLIKSNC